MSVEVSTIPQIADPIGALRYAERLVLNERETAKGKIQDLTAYCEDVGFEALRARQALKKMVEVFEPIGEYETLSHKQRVALSNAKCVLDDEASDQEATDSPDPKDLLAGAA